MFVFQKRKYRFYIIEVEKASIQIDLLSIFALKNDHNIVIKEHF